MSQLPTEGSRWRSKPGAVPLEEIVIEWGTAEMVKLYYVAGPRVPNSTVMHPTEFFGTFEPVPSD